MDNTMARSQAAPMRTWKLPSFENASFMLLFLGLPLAIYAQFDIDFDVALGISALLVLISAAVLLIVKLLPSWTRSGSTSAFPFARSGSN